MPIPRNLCWVNIDVIQILSMSYSEVRLRLSLSLQHDFHAVPFDRNVHHFGF